MDNKIRKYKNPGNIKYVTPKKTLRETILDTSLIIQKGKSAADIYMQFLTAEIRNENTRFAYATAIVKFSNWIDDLNYENGWNLSLDNIKPVHVAAYIDDLKKKHSVPTVKQNLSALNRLFKYMVVHQIIENNPAGPVTPPKYSQKKGKAPVLNNDETKVLLDSISTKTIKDKRDKAIISLMLHSCARVSAVVNMRVKDFFQQGTRYFFGFHEKGNKYHVLYAHSKARALVYDYITSAGIDADPDGFLFRSMAVRDKGKIDQLSNSPMTRFTIGTMIKKRAKIAGLGKISCHSFRAIGITSYLLAGGTLENAKNIANHARLDTTLIYDHRDQAASESEIEKIDFGED